VHLFQYGGITNTPSPPIRAAGNNHNDLNSLGHQLEKGRKLLAIAAIEGNWVIAAGQTTITCQIGNIGIY
jgi:hypothetical protein